MTTAKMTNRVSSLRTTRETAEFVADDDGKDDKPREFAAYDEGNG